MGVWWGPRGRVQSICWLQSGQVLQVRFRANLQKLLDDKLSQDAALNQLLEIEANLAKYTDSKQTEDSARGT